MRAPDQEGHLSVLFYSEGSTPVDTHIEFPGILLPANSPFGGVVSIGIPLVPTLPGAPYISVIHLRATLGPIGVTYYEHVGGVTLAYTPKGILLPNSCPRGGFPFAATFSFLDGSEAKASTAIPCPDPQKEAQEETQLADAGRRKRRLSGGSGGCRWPPSPRLAASAAATTSSSRTEPPGWMIAVTPASIASWGPSAKGKKASEASDWRRRAASPSAPRLGLLDRDAHGIHAAHLPGADPDRRAVARDHDRVGAHVAADLPGKAHVLPLGVARLLGGHHAHLLGVSDDLVAVLHEQAPDHGLGLQAARAGSGQSGSSSRRTFFFCVKTSSASGSKPGASSTSMNCFDSACAQAASTGRLSAITPP